MVSAGKMHSTLRKHGNSQLGETASPTKKRFFKGGSRAKKKCKRVGIKKTSFSLHLALQKYCTYRIFGWFDLETGGEKSEEGTAVWTMFVLEPAKTL